MSSPDYSSLIDGVIATLNENVLPELKDEYARGQTFAAIYLLTDLRTRGDWAASCLIDHLTLQLTAFEDLASLSQDDKGFPTAPFGSEMLERSVKELMTARQHGNEYLEAVQNWIDRNDAVGSSLERRLLQALAQAVELDIALSPKPIYGKVARGYARNLPPASPIGGIRPAWCMRWTTSCGHGCWRSPAATWMPTTSIPCATIRVSAWRLASCRVRGSALPVSRR